MLTTASGWYRSCAKPLARPRELHRLADRHRDLDAWLTKSFSNFGRAAARGNSCARRSLRGAVHALARGSRPIAALCVGAQISALARSPSRYADRCSSAPPSSRARGTAACTWRPAGRAEPSGLDLPSITGAYHLRGARQRRLRDQGGQLAPRRAPWPARGDLRVDVRRRRRYRPRHRQPAREAVACHELLATTATALIVPATTAPRVSDAVTGTTAIAPDGTLSVVPAASVPPNTGSA